MSTALTALLLSSAWWVPPPPPQCDREPTRRYTIEYVSPDHCKGSGGACMTFMPDGSCRIMIIRGPYDLDFIRHEKAHCNCPEWRD